MTCRLRETVEIGRGHVLGVFDAPAPIFGAGVLLHRLIQSQHRLDAASPMACVQTCRFGGIGARQSLAGLDQRQHIGK